MEVASEVVGATDEVDNVVSTEELAGGETVEACTEVSLATMVLLLSVVPTEELAETVSEDDGTRGTIGSVTASVLLLLGAAVYEDISTVVVEASWGASEY